MKFEQCCARQQSWDSEFSVHCYTQLMWCSLVFQFDNGCKEVMKRTRALAEAVDFALCYWKNQRT